jgi:hypothetical protein
MSNSYQTDVTYDQVRAHYDKELAKHGWTFRSHEALTYWAKTSAHLRPIIDGVLCQQISSGRGPNQTN